ncbi:hypothetical protein BDW75DRAFT_245094 [Aspergillus navahoensis]
MPYKICKLYHPSHRVPDLAEADRFFSSVFGVSSVWRSSLYTKPDPKYPTYPTDYCIFTPLAEVFFECIGPRKYVIDGVQRYETITKPKLNGFGWAVDGIEEIWAELGRRAGALDICSPVGHWESGQVIAPTVIGGVILLAMLIYLGFRSDDRACVPGYPLRSWHVLSQAAIAILTSLLLWFVPSAAMVLFQSIMGETGMTQAWHVSMYTAGLAGVYLLSTITMSWPKFIKWHIVGAVWMTMISISCLAVSRPSMRRAALAFNALLGIGQGYCIAISYVTAPMLAAPADMSLINGILSAFRNLGYSILQAVFFAVVIQPVPGKQAGGFHLSRCTSGRPGPSVLPPVFQAFQAAQATGSPEALFQVPSMTPTALLAIQGAAVEAAYNAWKFIFYIANTYVGLMIIFSVITPGTDRFLSWDVWARLNRGLLLGRKAPGTV